MDNVGYLLLSAGFFLFGVVAGFLARGTADRGEREMLYSQVDALYIQLRAANDKIKSLTDRDRRGRFVKTKDTGNE